MCVPKKEDKVEEEEEDAAWKEDHQDGHANWDDRHGNWEDDGEREDDENWEEPPKRTTRHTILATLRSVANFVVKLNKVRFRTRASAISFEQLSWESQEWERPAGANSLFLKLAGQDEAVERLEWHRKLRIEDQMRSWLSRARARVAKGERWGQVPKGKGKKAKGKGKGKGKGPGKGKGKHNRGRSILKKSPILPPNG